MTVVIRPADLDDPRVAALLEDHLAEMEPTAPPESRHALTADEFRMPGVRLWVAESGADVVGSVALKELEPGHLELKSMRVSSASRGRGLGRLLLDHALAEARRSGATRVSLETGVAPVFDAALRERRFHRVRPLRRLPPRPAQHVPHRRALTGCGGCRTRGVIRDG